jgi:HD-GYP domain-containing protein (c-di-GMP phosphodiesterase class II)
MEVLSARLQGDQTPLGARIFSIVDAVASDRPYRKAQWLDAAREQTKRCS